MLALHRAFAIIWVKTKFKTKPWAPSHGLKGQFRKRQEGSDLLKRKKNATKIFQNNGSCMHFQSVRALFGAHFGNDEKPLLSFPGICLKRPANDFMLDRASLLTVHIWSKLQ